MFVIDSATRAKIYSGGLYYTPTITIGNVTIPNSEIKSISVSDPIIDTTNEKMYIGTFIAKKLEIEFRTLQNFNLTDQIEYNIQINDNGVITTVPIGLFNIETSPADYYKTYKITALDNSIKFKKNIDISGYYTPVSEESQEITASYMLQVICDLCGVVLNPLSQDLVNINAKTGYSDTSFSGKQYISYIAEIMGGYAKIDRYGNLSIVPVKPTPVVTINVLASKSLKVDELYKVTRIRWENGINTPSEVSSVTDDGNTLYIRANNIFMSGTDEERQTLIDNLGNKVLGLQIQNITTENYADFTLDSWDIVTYTAGSDTYTTYYDNSFTFKGSVMGKVNVNIPTKNQEQTTNVIGEAKDIDVLRGIKTTIDQLTASLQILASNYETINGEISKINSSLYYQDSTKFRFVLQEQIVQRQDMSVPYTDSNGNTYDDVQYANQQGYTFDKDGLTIAKTDINGNYIEDTRSLLNGKGLTIADNKSSNNILFAGYNENTKESIVDTQNTTVRHYLNLNDGTNDVGRFETYIYEDGSNSVIDNTKRVGFFWTYD